MIWGHIVFALSKCVYVFVTGNLNLDYNFSTIGHRAFIPCMCLPCFKTFPTFKNWPYHLDLCLWSTFEKKNLQSPITCEPVYTQVSNCSYICSSSENTLELKFIKLNQGSILHFIGLLLNQRTMTFDLRYQTKNLNLLHTYICHCDLDLDGGFGVSQTHLSCLCNLLPVVICMNLIFKLSCRPVSQQSFTCV